jgi:predicted NAD/FAD-binding protein
MPEDNRKKIAVLGGGMGALTTVYALTSQPNWEAQYEITVYQLGWRLGAKGPVVAMSKRIQTVPIKIQTIASKNMACTSSLGFMRMPFA